MTLRPFAGQRPKIGKRVWIDPDATVLGQVTLGDDASVWPRAVVRGDVNRIVIGERSNVQDGVICHVTHDGPYTPGGLALLLGNDTTVGHGAVLHACLIGDRCLIGMAAIVLDGAQIEDDVLLAAGSLVGPGKRLVAGHLYRGRPAAKVRALDPAELDMLRYSADHYVRLKNQYLDCRDGS